MCTKYSLNKNKIWKCEKYTYNEIKNTTKTLTCKNWAVKKTNFKYKTKTLDNFVNKFNIYQHQKNAIR